VGRRPDQSSGFAGRLGTNPVREVRFAGERMALRPPPRRRGDATEHRDLARERIAPE
jgi:hypothetical protein